ncbi:glycosyl hydrolase family 28-related protein [Victivallis vadensis]|uniref:glycosyl hydrolase family 28-related protein n=1 Tax=Victivallis vadensis TaxID=172901 RepID=UPI003B8A98B4
MPFGLNVKSFGAKGDGVTDDTAAIQRAADAAMIRPQQRDWMCTRYYKAMHDAPAHEIFFPAGTYVISGPVVFNWSVSLRGTAGTTIRNTAPDKDSFFFEYALRCTIENLKFDGGFHQIRHWTNNLDTSTLLISNCEFRNAAKVSVHSASYRQRTEKQYKSRLEEIKAGVPLLRISPYIVERKNGKVNLIPRPEETLQEFENS